MLMIERKTARWNHAVNMWMMQDVLAPCMQNAHEPMSAPRCLGSAAISSSVAALVRKRRS